MQPVLHIYLLGEFRLALDETPISAVTVPRAQSLLAYLALRAGAPQSRSRLAFQFWPDSTEAQAHTNLRQLLHHLRHAFPDVDRFLQIDKQNMLWLPAQEQSPWTLDVDAMKAALAQAERAEQAADLPALRRALDAATHLYRDDLLPGCYDEWILAERDTLRQAYLQAAERLTTLLEDERDYDAAIKTARRLLRLDPLRETTYRQLMRFYAQRGDRVMALRVYHTCATTLERELGAEPSESTRALRDTLMRPDAASPLASPDTVASARAGSARGAIPPLIGRGAEWRLLRETWQRATGAHGGAHVVVISGEAGIGKTRLAEELEAWVGRQGMTSLSARCYAAEGRLPYAPLTTWLRAAPLRSSVLTLDPIWLTEVARLTPEALAKNAHIPTPAPMTEGWQRQRFFEALARAMLAARQPLLLALDDIQWCDDDTLEWLRYLVRFDADARLLLVATLREEESPATSALAAFLAALRRDGQLTEIALGPLNAVEAASLAEHVRGQPIAPDALDALIADTEGNPLFVVETARAGDLEPRDPAQRRETQEIAASPGKGAATSIPPLIRGVLAERVAQLSLTARDVATIAAVIGREFTFAALARVSRESEDTVVHGLDELWQRRIVREQGVGAADSYDFTHGKLREHIYGELSPTGRRLLHGRVAEALEALATDEGADLDALRLQLADHYERAGRADHAVSHLLRAGEAAHRIYANAEALRISERALALLTDQASRRIRRQAPWEMAPQAYALHGDTLAQVGRYQDAIQAYREALAHLPEHAEQISRAALHRKLATTWNQASTHPHLTYRAAARQQFQEAEEALTEVEDPSNPQWRQEWLALQFARIWPLSSSADDMTTAIEKAQPIVERYGTAEQREFLRYAVATRNFIRQRFITSAAEIERFPARREGIAAIERGGDKRKLGQYLLAFGVTLLFAPDVASHLDEACEHLEHALHVAEEMGNTSLQTRCMTFLPFVYRYRGEVERMRQVLIRAETAGAWQDNQILMGQRAWLAWREGRLADAETLGRLALTVDPRQPESSAFQWVARWPLIGIALARSQPAAAIADARSLLDPSQQPPPECLRVSIEAALLAWDTGQEVQALALLHEAASAAAALGYL